jgi:glycosyltransferase involved in cell wall biosynthesis
MENLPAQELFRCRICSDVIPYAESLTFSEKIALHGSYEYTICRIQQFQKNETGALITFIIPSLDRPTLMRTLQSLLHQTNSQWCAMIIFDGREPMNTEVKQLIETESRFFYMCINRHGSIDYPKHSAAGTVRNIAMNLVVTPWIGFVDDDDILLPEYVEKLVEEINITPNCDSIVFHMEVENQIIPNKECREIRNGQIGISFAIRSTLISDGFIFIQSDNEDFNMMNRINMSGKTIVISPYLTYYVNEIGRFPLINGSLRYIINPK